MERNRNIRRRRRGSSRLYLFRRRIDLRRFVPFVLFLAVFVVSAYMLIDYGVHSVQRKRDNDRMAAEFEQAFVGDDVQASPVPTTAAITPAPTISALTATPSPTLAPVYHDFSGATPQRAASLYSQNNDLVGWLYIKGVVSLPVVQRDNSFYLNHAFDGSESDGGTLFLDQYHPMAPETQHLLIHGHNMYDSSMFGIVSTYNKLSMVQNSGFASFSTLHAPEDYVICAVLRVSTDVQSEAYFNYVGTPRFSGEASFISFANELKARSMFDIPVDLQPSDALLSLSTCIDDDRLLVVFRRFREGESKESLQPLLSRAAKK